MKARRLIAIISACILVSACGPGNGSGNQAGAEKSENKVDAGIGKVLREMRHTADELVLSPMTMDNYVRTFGIYPDSYGWKVLKEEQNLHYRARLMAFVDRGCISRMGVEYTLLGDYAKQNRRTIEEEFEVSLPDCTCTMNKLFLIVIPQSKIQ
ncbi:MAG: hypothetical protein J5769_06275 [Bacteroidales bacterium]|nr:hypothetical protein [Bacteroidales bacterium]